MLSGQKRVEQLAIFPYVAWMLVICFALYTGYLAIEMQKAFAHLEQQCVERSVCVEWKK